MQDRPPLRRRLGSSLVERTPSPASRCHLPRRARCLAGSWWPRHGHARGTLSLRPARSLAVTLYAAVTAPCVPVACDSPVMAPWFILSRNIRQSPWRPRGTLSIQNFKCSQLRFAGMLCRGRETIAGPLPKDAPTIRVQTNEPSPFPRGLVRVSARFL